MKIIFDNEKQKENFLNRVLIACPSEVFDDIHVDDICHKHESCHECWETYIEMEVKEE